MSDFNQGAAPMGILVRALTDNIFVTKNLAYMNEGDRDGYNCYKHDIQNTLRARTPNPSTAPNSTTKKKNYKRNLVIVESFETFDPIEYHNYWKKYQPTGVFDWETLPVEIQRSLEELFLGNASEAAEELLMNGDGTLLTGLIPQLMNNALTSLDGATPTATQIVENSAMSYRVHGGSTVPAVALTTSNIFSKFEELIENQSKQMLKRPGRKFMVSPRTMHIYKKALRLELEFKGVDVTSAGVANYAGYEIIEANSFPDDAILLASMTGDPKTDAFQLGTSSSADFNNVTTDRIDKFSREWGMLLTFALDIFLVRPEEVCFYTKATIS